MTFSVLMFALLAGTLGWLAYALAVETVRAPVATIRRVRSAGPVSPYGRLRVQQRWTCAGPDAARRARPHRRTPAPRGRRECPRRKTGA